MQKGVRNHIISFILLGIILILVNLINQYFYIKIDLTQDKRYTIGEATRNVVEDVEDVMFVRLLLEGSFPAGFKRLQTSAVEMLENFKRINPNIEFVLDDPTEGKPDDVKKRQEELAKDGVFPTNLRVKDGTETQTRLIYPYALIYYGNNLIPVNLLENAPEFDQETNLNNSIGLLEYKLANAIEKIQRANKPILAFTTGHGELSSKQTRGLESLLREYYQVGRLELDSIVEISQEIAAVIIARPLTAFKEKEKFLLDQYLMGGGKLLFFIDALSVSLDSVAKYQDYIPPVIELDLEDMLFKYGCRINHELVLDLECSRIPQVIGMSGDKPQIELFPWYYHPLIASQEVHPVTKNLDRINLLFPTTIDTVLTKTPVKKTPILQSSQYSRTQLVPVRVGFDILKYEPDPDKFNKGNQVVGVLLEGTFPSLFENRLTMENQLLLESLGQNFRPVSQETRILVVSDGDLPRSQYDESSGRFSPLGFNKWENYTFKGNQDFLLNSLEYLLNPEGVVSSRTKEVKLRLLDKVRTEEEKGYWQFINIGLPILFIIIFGTFYHFFRIRKYSKSSK